MNKRFEAITNNLTNIYVMHIFITVFLLVVVLQSFGQQPFDAINPESMNSRYLEHIIKQKVDSIRVSFGLKPLINDHILYLSSQDHARYLTRENTLSHYQSKSRKKRTYHERAVGYGAEDFYVSENLAHVKLLKELYDTKTSVTYNSIAFNVLSTWLASIGNMANILAPSHVIAGMATWYDKDKMEIRIALSLASVAKGYKPTENKLLFPYCALNAQEILKDFAEKPDKRYDWNINPRPGQNIIDDYRKLAKRINTLGLVEQNDSVFVIFNNARRMDGLFVDRTDGLAIELLPNNYYSCIDINKPPIRREVEFTIKGTILAPVYRDNLLDNIIGQRRAPLVDLKFLAVIPEKFRNTDYSLNLIVLKKNRIADVITFNNAPQKVTNLNVTLSPAHDKMPLNDFYIPNITRDTLKLRVYFDQNKANVLALVADSISRWIKDKKLDSARVYSYASIEGTIEINKDLSERRANELIVFYDKQGNPQHSTISEQLPNQLAVYSDDKFVERVPKVSEQNAKNVIVYYNTRDGIKVPTIKVARENWHDFFQQIKGSKFEFLTSLNRDEVRRFVNERKNSRDLEPILARHRFTDLKLLAYKIVDNITIDGLAVSEYENLYKKITAECNQQTSPCNPSADLINRMDLIYLYLLNRNIEGRVGWHIIKNLPIALNKFQFDPIADPLANIYYNKLRFQLTHQGDYLSKTDSLNILKELNSFPKTDPVIAYNYFVALTKSDQVNKFEPFFQQRTLNEIKRLIESTEFTDFEKEDIDQLKLYYHFKNVEQEYFINRFGDFEASVKQSLDFIFNHYQQNPPNKKAAIDISMFLSAFQRYDEAQDIIEPFAFGEEPCRESLALYLKYFYANPRVKQNTDFYQFLKDAGDVLGQEDWCSLFMGEWPISIQVLDHEPLQIMYCKMCNHK